MKTITLYIMLFGFGTIQLHGQNNVVIDKTTTDLRATEVVLPQTAVFADELGVQNNNIVNSVNSAVESMVINETPEHFSIPESAVVLMPTPDMIVYETPSNMIKLDTAPILVPTPDMIIYETPSNMRKLDTAPILVPTSDMIITERPHDLKKY